MRHWLFDEFEQFSEITRTCSFGDRCDFLSSIQCPDGIIQDAGEGDPEDVWEEEVCRLSGYPAERDDRREDSHPERDEIDKGEKRTMKAKKDDRPENIQGKLQREDTETSA